LHNKIIPLKSKAVNVILGVNIDGSENILRILARGLNDLKNKGLKDK